MAVAGIGVVAGLGLAATVLTADDAPPAPVVPVPGTIVAIETPPPLLGPVAAVEAAGWLNTSTGSFDAVRGTVTVLHFWAIDCTECAETIPELAALGSEYGPSGLRLVAVHSPRFEYEEPQGDITMKAAELGIVWPIALDTDGRILETWQVSRQFLPRTYVIDVNGQIRYNHVGAGDVDVLESTVAWLLNNGGG